MITVYVGNAKPNMKTEYTDTQFNLMPNLLVEKVLELVKVNDFLNIRVYSDTVVNMLGEQIEYGNINKNDVEIITETRTYVFDSMGCIQGNWPFGIFNY